MNIALSALCSYDDMGIMSLRAVLLKAGYEVDAIFLKEFRSNQQKAPSWNEENLFVDLLKERKINFLGISFKSSHLRMFISLVPKLRKEIPNLFILVGGSHATICPEECSKYVDAVCVGEGEEAILDVVSSFQNKESIDTISNIYPNEIRPLVDVDKIPYSMNRDNMFYIDNETVQEGLRFPLYTTLTARGCPFSCSYCSTAVLRQIYSGKGSYVRQRSVNNVIEELVAVKKELPEVNTIQFNDDIFGMKQDWIDNFCVKYVSLVNLPFQAIMHPQYVTEQLLSTLSKTKLLKIVQVGIQAVSPKVSKIFNRHTPREVLLYATDMFHKYKINANYHFILDVPYAHKEDLQANLDFLLQVKRPFRISLYSLTHFPKTELTQRLLKETLIDDFEIEGDNDKCLRQIYITPRYNRNSVDKCYSSLLYLTQIDFVPKWFIRLLSKISYFNLHPSLLHKFNVLVDWVDRVFTMILPLIARGLKHAKSGKLNFKKLKSGLKSYRAIVKDKHNF